MQRYVQWRLGALVMIAVLALLTACGSNDSSSGSSDSTSTHNDADVAFATGMIPHHAQAIEMAKMAVTKAASKDVVALANQIQAAQKPEIDTMAGWLTSWGEPAPDMGMTGMDHGDMSSGGMTGMMTPHEMQQLSRQPAGPGFDRLWLQMMTKHHEGAIEMSRTELQDGQNADAQALAQQIIDAQQAEITTMKGLLQNSSS